MRRLFDRVTERLRAFLTQRDAFALVIQSLEGESPALLQILETLEQETTFALFWQFPESFTNAPDYVVVVVDSFASKLALVQQLQQREDMPVWPEMPAPIRDESRPPADRLRELMVFARSLMPTLQGALLVWVMFPGDVADPPAYAQLMRDVLRHEWPGPWCHHMRIIVRDDRASPALLSTLSEMPRVLWYEADLGSSAIEQALGEDISDESLPLEDRLQSLLLTAGMDQSHRRLPLAMEKYKLLLQHYSVTGNLAMTAVALNGMGEVYRDLGNQDEAGVCFESAAVAASDSSQTSTPILLNVFLNLGNLRMAEERWAEAEGYYDCSQKLATVLRYAEIKMMVLEQLGLAQHKQNKVSESLETWKAGAIIAKKLDHPELGEKHLQRLREHYRATGNAAGMRDIERQLAGVAKVADGS